MKSLKYEKWLQRGSLCYPYEEVSHSLIARYLEFFDFRPDEAY